MELAIKRPTVISVDAIRCVLAVRYDEEDMPNDYPHRKGETWDVTIDIASGQIRDWPDGVEPRDLYMKVCDSGSYYLLGGESQVAELENEYVPDCIPGEYGDYIDFKIDETGRITNWKCDADDVASAFFDGDAEPVDS